VPYHTDILLEGLILKDRMHKEWMVKMLCTYDFRRKQAVFELERIMLLEDAIYDGILPIYAEHHLLMVCQLRQKYMIILKMSSLLLSLYTLQKVAATGYRQ
jgi:2,5-furandicarboxylate decarboxylase 1